MREKIDTQQKQKSFINFKTNRQALFLRIGRENDYFARVRTRQIGGAYHSGKRG